MAQNNSASLIQRYIVIGFGVLVALSWMNELLNLPRRIFGRHFQADVFESITSGSS